MNKAISKVVVAASKMISGGREICLGCNNNENHNIAISIIYDNSKDPVDFIHVKI